MFNVGKDAFTNSNAYKNLSQGNIEGFYTEAFDPEQGFTKITGADNIKRVDEGLVNRRQQEKQLAEGTWKDPYASIY
jgi:GH24 family phage-related lysozyme (muramidase)